MHDRAGFVRPSLAVAVVAVAVTALVVAGGVWLGSRPDSHRTPRKAAPAACRTIQLTDAALRAALAEGGSICLPPGRVDITKTLRVTKDGTKLIGAGRDATVLRMAFGPQGSGPLIALPAEWSPDFGNNPPPETMRVHDVEIARLSIDGAREGNPNTYGDNRGNTLRFGIQATVSTNAYFHDLHVYDIAGDGIGFGDGSGVNINPRVEDVLVERIGRNGLHLGSSDGAIFRRAVVLDTPGLYWENAGAGNGLDIEVEGVNPRVTNTLIEDSVFERNNAAGIAGCGIQIARAFGPIDNVTVRNTRIRNHQFAVYVQDASHVLLENNTFETGGFSEDRATSHGVMLSSSSPEWNAGATIRNNRFLYEPITFNAESMVTVVGDGHWDVEDNLMLGGKETFWAWTDKPSHITSANNRYRTVANGELYKADRPDIQTFTDVGSTPAT